MPPVEALTYAVVMAAAASYLIWLLPGPCKCEKCGFHVNERAMARLKAKEDEERRAADQAALQHDYWHKGAGWTESTPDKFNCNSETCPRNRKPPPS